MLQCYIIFFFFFQAEDGIRDWSVTGVQTCALPISQERERVNRIGTGCKWIDVSGVTADFLTVDEIKNLTISRGTLNNEEREKINHHIVATIKMLEALPWPKLLSHVPEYAGSHPELRVA